MNRNLPLLILIILFSCDSGATHESVFSASGIDSNIGSIAAKDEKLEQASPIDGFYVGLEEMCFTEEKGKNYCYGEPEYRQVKWFRPTEFTIKGDSVHVFQSTIQVKGQDTIQLGPDGGYYFHAGPLQQTDSVYMAKTVMYNCDFCRTNKKLNPETGEEEEVVVTKDWLIKQKGKDLLINNVLYKKSVDEIQWLKARAKAERPEKSIAINPKFPLKNLLGTWSSESTYSPKFVINEKVYYLVGDGETGGALYKIENDSIKLFYNDDGIMSRGRIKEATGKQLIIDWEGGSVKRYERYR